MLLPAFYTPSGVVEAPGGGGEEILADDAWIEDSQWGNSTAGQTVKHLCPTLQYVQVCTYVQCWVTHRKHNEYALSYSKTLS